MVPDRSFFLYGAFWWDLKQQMGLVSSVTLREYSLVNTHGPSRSGKRPGASKPLRTSWWLPLRKLGRSRNSGPTASNITTISVLYTDNSKFLIDLVFYNFSTGSEFSGVVWAVIVTLGIVFKLLNLHLSDWTREGWSEKLFWGLQVSRDHLFPQISSKKLRTEKKNESVDFGTIKKIIAICIGFHCICPPQAKNFELFEHWKRDY